MENRRSTTADALDIPNSCRKPRSQRQSYNPYFKDGYKTKDYKDKSCNFNFHGDQTEKNSVQLKSVKHTKNGFFHKPMERTPSINDRTKTNLQAGPSFFNNSILVQCKNDSWLSPGNLVWAKKANNEWWPAEILDATSLLKCTGSYSIGRNLVKYFGNNALAWLDPVREISAFHTFYEERSKNSSVFFQVALEQALQKHLNSTSEISPLKSTSSQDTESENTVEEKSTESCQKRKRKIKLHFDDLTQSEKPIKRIRRIKIMRHLGLMAPAGSPFSLRNN